MLEAVDAGGLQGRREHLPRARRRRQRAVGRGRQALRVQEVRRGDAHRRRDGQDLRGLGPPVPDHLDRRRPRRKRLGRLEDADDRRSASRIQIVGDDLFVTNPEILARGIKEKVANSILVKLNQIGTVTETLDAVAMARDAGYTQRHLAPLGRDRRHDHRRSRRRHERRADQDRLRQPHRSRRQVQPVAAHRRRTRRAAGKYAAGRDQATAQKLQEIRSSGDFSTTPELM